MLQNSYCIIKRGEIKIQYHYFPMPLSMSVIITSGGHGRPPSPGSAFYVLYWHADFHTVNDRQGEGGGGSANTAVIGVLAALLIVAILVLVITGLLWWRSVCVCVHT